MPAKPRRRTRVGPARASRWSAVPSARPGHRSWPRVLPWRPRLAWTPAALTEAPLATGTFAPAPSSETDVDALLLRAPAARHDTAARQRHREAAAALAESARADVRPALTFSTVTGLSTLVRQSVLSVFAGRRRAGRQSVASERASGIAPRSFLFGERLSARSGGALAAVCRGPADASVPVLQQLRARPFRPVPGRAREQPDPRARSRSDHSSERCPSRRRGPARAREPSSIRNARSPARARCMTRPSRAIRPANGP